MAECDAPAPRTFHLVYRTQMSLKENHFGDFVKERQRNEEIQQDMGRAPTDDVARGVVPRTPWITSGSKCVDPLQPISRVAEPAVEEEEDADTNRLFARSKYSGERTTAGFREYLNGGKPTDGSSNGGSAEGVNRPVAEPEPAAQLALPSTNN